MVKIEEIDSSIESEEEFKKIDDYVKKKVREDNICKTPERNSKNNSKELPSLNLSSLSPDVSVSDRKDLIKKNKSTDIEPKNLLEGEQKQSKFKKENHILSFLNRSSEKPKSESEAKSESTPTTINSNNEESKDKELDNNLIRLKPKKSDSNKKKVKILETNSTEHPNNVLMDETVIEKKGRKKSPRKTQKRSKSKKVYEAIEHNSIMESLPTQGDNIGHRDEIFGEKVEQQQDRLKKVSPFGQFNTFKLFKIIIKNGEDLRQEQFATQLINEFYQIFQLEEVDLWLKPYEILSTGHNVGLIECVPNSLSLDQLKRKSKNCSTLSQYFETYFGPKNNESKQDY